MASTKPQPAVIDFGSDRLIPDMSAEPPEIQAAFTELAKRGDRATLAEFPPENEKYHSER